MVEPIVPVILAGGQGSRLWPMSRSARPKQFLPLTGHSSLYQQALERVSDRSRYHPPLVLTNNDYRFIVAEQAEEVGQAPGAILLEPAARNTATAIATAAAYVDKTYGPRALLHILPSDHLVTIDASYWQSLDAAIAAARDGRLVTFGIKPTHPETGYGYIKSAAAPGDGAARIERFVEKPDAARASEMLAEGGYFWNSGMFMLGAGAFLAECERLAPDILLAARDGVSLARTDLDFVRLHEESFLRAPNISVDYAIFEKTDKAAMVAVDFPWSDLGSWDAVWKTGKHEGPGNVTHGAITLDEVQNSLVLTDHAHVAVSGLDSIAVVATYDAVYVGRLDRAQSVGDIVKRLKDDPKTLGLTEIHRTAYRPWGGYTSMLQGDRFQVKRLFVKPGKKLSLQKHHHRAEHWIVVRGTAEVTIDGTVTTLSENQSIYLPQGCLHRLANPGKIELELIEVQTGSYLGEDDIIRVEDEFGRT
ncbi:MAG: mannose-1-phosphate guanylyltransferase/mannose-6-phosphate isomerase [Devosia sp.]|uniref:mannose-1-phosphate guanylyltransferase/mannose-6-phosphate isomerase n=1 Tax=Devosia sp. TaxID=1871048 RepID=UPI0024CCD149|nr:mannose-1-phosphate guanylyltransferase/mannose-6-phosphate isomerase [Devosia sp.]UYO00545.1 MAG: mannose-1-phosphate guanylyltransferase/mannose-6-phosphate isomerase [Devosia sp.]